MLVELSVVEQKYQAVVLAVVGDAREVTDVARQFGASRQTLHAWLVRYEAGGLAGLAPRSRRRGRAHIRWTPGWRSWCWGCGGRTRIGVAAAVA